MPDVPKPAKQKLSPAQLIGYALALLTGAAIGFFGMMAVDDLAQGNFLLFLAYILVMLLGMVLAYFGQIVLHEGGHMLFGLLTGYRFISFNILGFIWQKGADGKIRTGRMQIASAGGQCLMAPPEDDDGHYPFVLYNLGGVLMNLLSAALFGVLAAVIPLAPVRILLIAQAVVGVALGLLNGLPLPTPALQNDGKNLLCIARDAHARRAFWVQLAMAAEQARGRRLKDMPDKWFAPFPEEKMGNPIVAAIAVLHASRLIDMLDFAQAEREIRSLLARREGLVGLYRMSLACDGAVCELIAGRPGTLTASLDSAQNQQLMKAMPKNPSILRTKYALALLRDRDATKAEEHLALFDTAAIFHPYPQEIEAEREIILAIQNAALNGGVSA